MTRLVTMPEWQGAGVGSRFLNFMAQRNLEGKTRYGKALPTFFHTSHPQLCGYLRHSKKWEQVSAILYGGNKVRSHKSLVSSGKRQGKKGIGTGYGGHFRAVQGFKYIGDRKA